MRTVLVSSVLLLLVPSQVAAQLLDDTAVEARLRLVEERLDASRRHGQLWQYGWMAVSLGGGAAGIVQATKRSGEDREGHIAEAVVGAAGVAYLVMRPMEARHGADSIRAMPTETPSQRYNRLLAAEALLARNAERAKERTDWKMHVGNVAFNAALGAFVLGFGNVGDAGIVAGSGALAGALQLWSEPRRPLRDWEEYQTQAMDDAGAAGRAWSLTPQPAGLALKLRF